MVKTIDNTVSPTSVFVDVKHMDLSDNESGSGSICLGSYIRTQNGFAVNLDEPKSKPIIVGTEQEAVAILFDQSINPLMAMALTHEIINPVMEHPEDVPFIRGGSQAGA